ncbi:MAG: 7-cyano-7-deazaguanine synthase, partial [Planctomycetia bacterium]
MPITVAAPDDPSTPLALPVGSSSVAVLCSGGLDSAVLTADLARSAAKVFPLFVRFGLIWEAAEEAALRRFVAALDNTVVQPPTTFDLPLRSVYGDHWSTTGRAVPDAASPDEAVFLPGRNVLL